MYNPAVSLTEIGLVASFVCIVGFTAFMLLDDTEFL